MVICPLTATYWYSIYS